MNRSITCLSAVLTISSSVFGAYGNPKHFVDPTAIPTYGPNNYVPVLGNGPGNVYGIESMGTPNVTDLTNLWAVGDAHTTKQEFTDLYARRVDARTANFDLPNGFIHDGSAALSTPTITSRSPGYITGSGNYYSFTGDYSAYVNVANYGGTSNTRAGGTLVLLQVSAGINPDLYAQHLIDSGRSYSVGDPTGTYENGFDPLGIVFTQQDGSSLPQAAEILSFGVNFGATSVDSSFGPVPWQELLWAAWLPEWTGDVRVDFGIAVHAAFSSARVDTAIGSMQGDPSVPNFTVGVVPEPASLSALALSVVALRRRRRDGH